jgi:AraC-like DNA-binding protein
VAIVSFWSPYTIDGEQIDSFAGGLSDRPIVIEHVGTSGGVQIDFTPLGARRCLGVPMDELTNRVIALEDVFGRAAPLLVERLHDARGWPERFALLDAALLRRLAIGPEPASEVAWSLQRLVAAEGRLAIGALAAEVGWSRRHLAARWRRDVGLAPKAVARILRFERAVRLLSRDDGGRLAEIAFDCGYADQSHLNREFRALAGSTPGEQLRRAEVTFVQDEAAARV